LDVKDVPGADNTAPEVSAVGVSDCVGYRLSVRKCAGTCDTAV